MQFPTVIPNIFDGIPESLPTEHFQTLITTHNVQIERIVSDGHATPVDSWYDQAWDEWVLLLSGSAGIVFETEEHERELKPGDYLLIPSGCRHRVAWTDPHERTVWLAVHIGHIRTDT
ncbi:MAG TPA: cupin domain-containing protein [Desulfuromonadales bacterium]|nr:cupin domain-containing protein [Desulfuromonadales bacterium]